ncbi:MAG: amidase family protein [Deferribacterota bacterium]|nr:amidase family protein [Deferribacterota bacterium]
MTVKEVLKSFNALTLASLIRKGEISSEELCLASISLIESINPNINAVITKTFERAIEDSKKAKKGIFAGVPFLVKDLLCYEKGVYYAMGCKALKNYKPDHDSELLKRYKDTGLIILGRTNVPEFGLLATTEPKAFGPTRNPFGLEYSAGGSSGGSAAAVAAGIVPMASGNDGGGSIRIPASNCNLFGLKPSRGRNPTGPLGGEYWLGAVTQHVLTKSVADSAYMLDATSYPEAGAPFIIDRSYAPFHKSLERLPKKLKIAYTTKTIIDSDIAYENKQSIIKMCNILEKMGHKTVNTFPKINGVELSKAFFKVFFAYLPVNIFDVEKLIKRRVKRDDVELLSWFTAKIGENIKAKDILLAKREWELTSRTFGEFFKDYDLILTPTLAYPPPKLGTLIPDKKQEALLNIIDRLKLIKILNKTPYILNKSLDALRYTPFTFLANVTGLPAASIPTDFTKEGLPIGTQFIAPFGREDLLFSLSAVLEKELDWAKEGEKHLKI